jgi:nitrogenase molybdenum-iron protein beta chain
VAYFRSHLSRHFKEPTACVSSSMTEDAAVFGGLTNLTDGLQNARALYKPDAIAVSTTCMAEVIGDDLKGFIENARNKEAIPKDYPVPFAHTPSFVGSHVTGYDNMMKGVLVNFWTGAQRVPDESINFIGGFDGFAPGNLREIKRLFAAMDVQATVLSDVSDIFDTPTDGEYRMYDGGTPLAAVKAAVNAKATVAFQQHCSEKTLKFAA